MATKRDHDSLACSDTEVSTPTESSNKRQRKQNNYNNRKQNSKVPGVDPTYGQRNAFPVDSLATPTDDDLEFEDQSDALAYLRSVQQETKQIPHVVVAPKAGPQLPPELETDRSIYQTGVGDTRGYYADGAYTAVPEPVYTPDDEPSSSWEYEYSDPVKKHTALVESYCTSLLNRYTSLRTVLQSSPPRSAVDSLPADHETEVEQFSPRSSTFTKWEHRLRYTDPLPAQLASMDKVSVLRLLRVVLGGNKFLRRGFTLRERTSRWIWALLARLPDRGELDSIEIGWVRDLGKRAVAVSISREHARALSEVVDRAQLEAFGLKSVLTELDYEEEVAEVIEVDEPSESKVTRANSSSPAPQGVEEEVVPAQARLEEVAGQNGEDVAMELEDGEVDESDEASVPRQQPTPTEPQVEESKEAELDMEDGEIADDQLPLAEEDAIAAAKARLLASLETTETWEKPKSWPVMKQHAVPNPLAERFNMRTTVNMILTVAGEFYGQRDLLQFRAPFAEF